MTKTKREEVPRPKPHRNRRLLEQMTLEEKAGLTSGANFWNTKAIPRLGIPSIMLTDGPHGIRKQGGAADHLGLNKSLPATCFPTAATLANSWDDELLGQVGEALGAEAAREDVRVLLGPGLNIKRNPLGGRNFEYFSEDPLLSGRLAAAFIRGVQSRSVAACPKHFAVNSQETHRMSIDEIVDERALHEIYLEGFRLAVAEGRPWALMSSYNRINGTYANEHAELLDRVLRGRWGFDGLIVTDWGGNNDRVAGLRAGNALEMPSTDGVTDAEVVESVRAGDLDEAVLDQRVDELLTLIDRTGGPATDTDVDMDAAHHRLAVWAAHEGIVLLQNRGGVLPLGAEHPGEKVAVIGDFAERPRIQGAGSSLVRPTRIDSPLERMRDSDLNIVGFARGYRRHGGASERLRREALALARSADKIVAFVGLDESYEAEAADRPHMHLPKNQLALVRDLVRLRIPVVVVLVGGSPVELPFAPYVGSIVHGYLPGQGGGQAIADILNGRVNPSGKLAESYPLVYGDVPSSADFGRTEATAEHRESIYVGYRYYDKVDMAVRFPFGHGLSYSTFEYSDLRVEDDRVRVRVKNTSATPGAEIVQVYVGLERTEMAIPLPDRELRGYARIGLAAGESREVTIALGEQTFRAYDPAAQRWRPVPGRYRISVGASSRDIRQVGHRDVAAEAWTIGLDPATLPHYFDGRVEAASGTEFAALLGRELPSPDFPRGRPLVEGDIVAQCRGRRGAAGALYRTIDGASRLLMLMGFPLLANNSRFLLDLPFRSIPRLSGGKVNSGMLTGLLRILNGDWRGGFPHLARETQAHHRMRKTHSCD